VIKKSINQMRASCQPWWGTMLIKQTMTYIFVVISALCCPFTEASSSWRPALLIIRFICSQHNSHYTALIYTHKTRVVDIAVLVMLTLVSAIHSEYWCKYQRYFSYAVSIWISAILFHIFLAIFDTNTFVVRCTIVKTVDITVTEGVQARTVDLHLK